LRDKLHQDARLELVPRVRRVFERLLAESIPVCVSGAGPTLLAFELEGQEVPDPGSGWRVLRLEVHSRGAEVSDVTNAMPPT